MDRHSPPSPATPREPLVVFDWNVLRALPKSIPLPSDISILVPETVLLELVGLYEENAAAPPSKQMTESQLDGHARKLAELAATCSERFWIGRYWDELSRAEFDPLVRIKLTHLVNHEMSPASRGEFLDPADWPAAIHAMLRDGAHLEHNARKDEFVRFGTEWTAYIQGLDADTQRAVREDLAQAFAWIRRPEFLAAWLTKANPKFSTKPRFSTMTWADALSRVPDRLAQARWARLMAWYALTRSMTPQRRAKDVGNSFEDAHYAFLASYTKCLATEDDQLIEAVSAVYQGVRIWRPRKDGWSTHPFAAPHLK